MDPSHASYVHNRVISNREDAAPMRMHLSGKVDPNKGFQVEHGGYAVGQQKDNMKAKRWFIPPCTIRCMSLPLGRLHAIVVCRHCKYAIYTYCMMELRICCPLPICIRQLCCM